MTNRERFHIALEGKLPPDRLPTLEWAPWWNLTKEAWEAQGMPQQLSCLETMEYWNLDLIQQYFLEHRPPESPHPTYFGGPVVNGEAEYQALIDQGLLYNIDALNPVLESLRAMKNRHDAGEVILWMTADGFFWYPRTLLGIEQHLYAFYDQPELIHRMNQDVTDFFLKAIEAFCEVATPDFMSFQEDMSYNLGPMLSEECFEEFIAPYYAQVIPALRAHGIKVFVDTDGDVEPMLPWLLRSGVDGILPLERQAGVDVNRIKARYPKLLILGGYDKTVMHKGESAMRAEFERILPAMRMGGFINSVDHQTPPDVSIENYRIYLRLLREYAQKAVKE